MFDGWKGGSRQETFSVTGGVTVVYSRLGEKADVLIKRIISKERREWIVVTSDREIASYAWSVGSIPIPSEDFLYILKRKEIINEGRNEDYDEEYYEPQKKGNPRKLSRKGKAVRRALSKL